MKTKILEDRYADNVCNSAFIYPSLDISKLFLEVRRYCTCVTETEQVPVNCMHVSQESMTDHLDEG